MTTKTIPLADIHVPEDRLRPVKEAYATLYATMLTAGRSLPPVKVRSTPNGARKWTLVSGAHRLRGHAIAGRDSIECMVVKADAETAREEEIEENLFRNELSALEKIDAVAEYRRLFEIRFGQVKAGNPEFSNCANLAQLEDLSLLGIAEDSEQGGFFGRVTERLGLSRRQAQRFSTIARTLQPRLKAALQQSAAEDHLSLIERFSRQTPEDQVRLALAMETETGFDAVAAEALVFARPQLSMAAKRMATVTSNFSALGKRERRRLLREMVLQWRDDFEWALNAADDAEEDPEEHPESDPGEGEAL